MQNSYSHPRSREARQHKRFRVRKDILLFTRYTFAEILDISASGVCYRCLVRWEDHKQALTLIDLLNNGEKIYIGNIPCEPLHVEDEFVSPLIPLTVRRTCGLKFAPANETQKARILTFIEKSVIPFDNHRE